MGGDAPRIRFGVLSKGTATREGWLELAVRCQGEGFDTLVLPDHQEPQLAFGPAIAAAATVATTLRFGTMVTNLDLRVPELVANSAATVALLTDDRFELGIGAGWKPRDYQIVGRDLEAGPRRFERFVANFGRLSESLQRETAAHARSSGGDGEPVSWRTRIPLFVGAGGGAMLEFAARHADVVGITRRSHVIASARESARDVSEAAVRDKIARVRRACMALGREVTFSVLFTGVEIGARVDETVRTLAEKGGVEEKTVRTSPELLYAASASEAADRLQEMASELGIGYFVIPDSAVEVFSPVLKRFR